MTTDTPTPDRSPAALEALTAEVIRLRAECFALAAGACSGHYGDDYGNSRCSLVDVQRTRAEAAEALLREAGEVLERLGLALDEDLATMTEGEWEGSVVPAAQAAHDLAAKIRGRG